MFGAPLPDFNASVEDIAFTMSTLQTLIDAIEACVAAGIFRHDAGDLSIELWALGHGVASLWAAGLLEEDLAREAHRHIMQNTLRGLLMEAADVADRAAVDDAAIGR